MKQEATLLVEAAAITDRGLSEKRPVNEDSYLVDVENRIFVVADGVGGAQAGEVASRMAVETLAEAFRHKHLDEDVEELMEIAIQRANDRIYRLSQENPSIEMMATTIVALHLDGRRATIGHVGDSRLYRLTPDGKLHRETEDHTVVEEEVRAGRMTAEEAAMHPARNVINRALGAETLVEVDTRALEVEDGTTFLLCSDGITRHISDEEIRRLLLQADDLRATCEQMKRLCYERGAEDNLTAVIVRIGARHEEETVVRPGRFAPEQSSRPRISTIAVPVDDAHSAKPRRREEAKSGAFTKILRALGLLLLFGLVAGAAFYAGMNYEQQRAARPETQATPTPEINARELEYERQKREIDHAPRAMLNRMTQATAGEPLASTDPEFLYLFGRAALLAGEHQQAAEAFRRAIALLEENKDEGTRSLQIETRLWAAAAALRSRDPAAIEEASRALDQTLQSLNQKDFAPTPALSP